MAITIGRMTKTLGGVSMAKIISGIYAIVNRTNGKQYIGSSWNINYRWDKHLYLLRNGRHHSKHLQHAWNVYGESCFDIIVIETCDTSVLVEREQYYIDTVHPEYNINVCAGSRLGTPHSDETKEKLRQANLGKKYSDETKMKHSVALKGMKIPHSAQWVANIIAARLGYKHSQETKNKMSVAHKGKKLTDEDKKNKSLAAMGNQSTLGFVHTDETKAKMSKIKKEWWANKKKKDIEENA
jgi:hypothetical protein